MRKMALPIWLGASLRNAQRACENQKARRTRSGSDFQLAHAFPDSLTVHIGDICPPGIQLSAKDTTVYQAYTNIIVARGASLMLAITNAKYEQKESAIR